MTAVPSSDAAGPEITVVVPYHNEKHTIRYTLEQVGLQTLPPRVAIFVDSSSTDESSETVTRWISENAARYTTEFRNVFEHSDTPASSKNVGIRNARTDWVAFMDCGQEFATDWLENQFRFAVANSLDVVSGVVHLRGENWVDRCAVAQSYGYKRNRPCVPTTLVRRAVFDRTGLFLEGKRSGYDVAWLGRLRKTGITRGINDKVAIGYIGTNFASTLGSTYRKSAVYQRPVVAMEGWVTPYFYLLAPLLVAGAALVSMSTLLVVGLLYFVARTFVIPVMKSRSFLFFREHPVEALLGLGLVGLTIDLGKFVGTLRGVGDQYSKRRRAAADGTRLNL